MKTASFLVQYLISFLWCMLLVFNQAINAQGVGVQVWVEQGQSEGEIDQWFKVLAEHQVHVAQLSISPALLTGDNKDYERYDLAFAAARKNKVMMQCEIPYTQGGVLDTSYLSWMQHTIGRYANHRALERWMISINPKTFSSKDSLTIELHRLVHEIRKHDPKTPVQLSVKYLFYAFPDLDFTVLQHAVDAIAWRIDFSRDAVIAQREDYAIGIAAMTSLLRSVSLNQAVYISGLPTGDNFWEGSMQPPIRARDIEQWLWTGIGAGADQLLLCCLNTRRKGIDAGIGALLDFQHHPTDRLMAIAELTNTLERNKRLFRDLQPVKGAVSILVSRETLLMFREYDDWKDTHWQSLFAFYNALLNLGIPVTIEPIETYDWSTSEKDRTVLLANMLVLDPAWAPRVKNFVENGNRLIATGLTGFYNPEQVLLHQSENPYEEIFGAKVKEVRTTEAPFLIDLKGLGSVPFHQWYSTLTPTTTEPMAIYEREIIAARQKMGAGEVLFIPAMIGVEAWKNGGLQLRALVSQLIANDNKLFTLSTQHNIIAQTLESPRGYVLVLTNMASAGGQAVIRWQGNPDVRPIHMTKGSKWEGNGLLTLPAKGVLVLHVSK